MENTSLSGPDVIEAVKTGGGAILPLIAYWMYRAGERLARIEKALEKYLKQHREE